MNLNQVARVAYMVARGSRDLVAISKGPSAIIARLVRKGLGRLVSGPINRI